MQLGALRFNAQTDEADVAKIEPGMSAVVTLDAYPGQEFPTKVTAIRGTAVPTTTGGTAFPVLLSLAGRELRIGMTGNVSIRVEDVTDALVVPTESVTEEGGKSYVYVVSGEKVSRRAIKPGVVTDDATQVLNGLAEGETVVKSGAVKLDEGMNVKTGGAR